MSMERGDRAKVLCLHLPSPPRKDVLRDYAGGFGVSLPSPRRVHGHGLFTQPCLSLIYTAAILGESGYDVSFIDAQALRMSKQAIRSRVESEHPNVIVAVLSLPSLYSDLALLRELKHATSASIVAMGTSCRPPELLDEVLSDDTVDAAITGDPEVVAAPLIEQLLSERAPDVPGTAVRGDGGRVVRREGGDLTDVDTLPLPAFDTLPMEHYVTWEFGHSRKVFGKEFGAYPRFFPLFLSRGCPYVCSYCPYPVGVGKRWQRKSVDHVLEEVGGLVAAGTSNILLRDQTVGEDLDYLASVCEGLIAADLGVQWLCEARPGSLPRGLMELMGRSGCIRIHYGVETGDSGVFATQAKRGIAPDEVDRCLRDTEDAGILPSVHFLVGFPQDTWQTISATLDLIERCGVRSGDCSLMTPYPGTRHYERMRAEGRILVSSWEDFTGTEPIVRVDGLSPVELVTARWRILAAIDANRHRGVTDRIKDASAAFRGGFASITAGPTIDVAMSRSTYEVPHRANDSAAGGRIA